MTEANRSRTRVKYSAHVLAKTKDRDALKGTVRDIALDTIYLYIVPAFAINEEVSLEIIQFRAGHQQSMFSKEVLVKPAIGERNTVRCKQYISILKKRCGRWHQA